MLAVPLNPPVHEGNRFGYGPVMQGSKLVDDVSASRQYMLVGSLLAIS